MLWERKWFLIHLHFSSGPINPAPLSQPQEKHRAGRYRRTHSCWAWPHRRGQDSPGCFQPSKYQWLSSWSSIMLHFRAQGFFRHLNFQFLKGPVMGKGPSGRGCSPLASADHKFRAGCCHGSSEGNCSLIWEKAHMEANNTTWTAEKTPKESGFNSWATMI